MLTTSMWVVSHIDTQKHLIWIYSQYIQGKYRPKKNIDTGIVHVVNTYETRGFKVTAVYGDNEFDLDNIEEKYKQQ